MKRIQLQKNKAFPWHESERIIARGELFGPDGTYFAGSDILRYFGGIESFPDLEERVKYANGHFSVIYANDNDLFVAVDPNRLFPLFYRYTDESWNISDDPLSLVDSATGAVRINELADVEFQAAAYVTGNETLIEGVYQVQAGEVIRFQEDQAITKFYHNYRTHYVFDDEYIELKSKAMKILKESFGRFIVSLENRHVVLPLSGGFDSRLIASMLRRFGYEKVTCITYGRKGNPEINISKQVADRLGFKWVFVEYTPELIKNFINDPQFASYYPFSGRASSMFYMQEYFAVKYLQENNLIPEDSIFVPGLYGDFIAGGMLNKHGNLYQKENIEQIAERIYRIKYCYKQPGEKMKTVLADRIQKNLEAKFQKETDLAYSIHEDWDYKEKYAKFIANSTAIYLFFGYEFRLALCDMQWVEFFQRLPMHAKVNKYLYDDLLTNDIFEAFGINFKRELQPAEREIRHAKLKNKVKFFLPEGFKRVFVKRKDDLFYHEITRYFRNDLAKKGIHIRISGNSYNSLIIQWYAKKIRELLIK